MGGRGSSSFGAGPRRESGAPVGKMTDRQLSVAASSLEREIADAESVLARTSNGHVGYLQGTPWGSKRDHDEYVAAYERLHGQLMPRRDEVVSEMARRSAGSSASARGTFVNSYGEATTRNITSQSYEAAQRRLRRDVDSFLGRR